MRKNITIVIITFFFIGAPILFYGVNKLLVRSNTTESDGSTGYATFKEADSMATKVIGRRLVYFKSIPKEYQELGAVTGEENKTITLIYKNPATNEGIFISEFLGADIPYYLTEKITRDNIDYYFDNRDSGKRSVISFKKDGLLFRIMVTDKNLQNKEELLKIASST